MLDIRGYRDKKAKGFASLIKVADGVYALSTRKFNPETGEELPAEVFEVNMEEIDTERMFFVSRIADIDALKAECEALL